MKLEPCPWCRSEDVRLRVNGYVTCRQCDADGPMDDPNGEKWNTLSRRVHGQTTETGPMPWRLQIAAMLFTTHDIARIVPIDEQAHAMLHAADALIAAHKGGAA